MKPILPSQFWNEEVSSSRSLDGVVHALRAEPPPLGLVAGSRLSRSQQLLLLQRFLGIPCTPSFAVDADNNGGLVLDRVLGSTGGENWWATLTGRIRPQRMLLRGDQRQSPRTSVSGETSTSNSFDKLKESANRFLGSSLYALCFRSRLQLGSRTTLSSTSEIDNLARQSVDDQQAGEGKSRIPWRGRVALRHKLDQHQILLESAYHERYVDRESGYWDVPQTVSLDMASRGAPGGLRYRLGVHHSAGAPQRCGGDDRARKVPSGGLPGLRFQAGASMEKSLDLWKTDPGSNKSYSFFEARPCISVSGVLGGLVCATLDPTIGGRVSRLLVEPFRCPAGSTDNQSATPLFSDPRYSTGLFASAGFNAQFGQFEKRFLDFTKVGIRVDLGSVSAVKSTISSNSNHGELGDNGDERGHPTLVLSLQQQVLGPLRARVDSRVSVDPSNLKQQPYLQEIVCGLDYPLEATGASKLSVWYSPTRREGMAEFRVLER